MLFLKFDCQYSTMSLFKAIAVILSLLLFFSCQKPDSKYVSVDDDSFQLQGEKFFPLMLNYIVHFRNIDGEKVLSPTFEYDSLNQFDSFSKEEVYDRLNTHFKLIAKMGFNSIRLVSLNNVDYDKFYPEAALSFYDLKGKEHFFNLNVNLEGVISEIDKVVQIAKSNGLRTMILLPRPRKQEQYDYNRKLYIKTILNAFKDEEYVFAYDFFNEPLYFDNSEFKNFYDHQRRKENVYELVDSWATMMKEYAPKQLFTIGYAEPLEVFEWDPTLLPVDFVTFHTYNPLRVPNEIYWYANNVDKPWMIGETSLPADNDSISYEEQAVFMKDALQRTLNCGGAGFGWWQFQDVFWGPFEHNYTSLVDHQGITVLEGGDTIFGTVKEAGKVLPEFPLKKNGDCDCWVNYYNILGYKNYVIKGTVLDASGKPVKDAVIRGWNKSWRIGANTFSKEDGKFKLYSNTEFVNFEVSAPGKNTSKFYLELEYKPKDSSLELNLEDESLEYHDIHYKWFLKNPVTPESTFDFKEDLFDNYKLESTMTPVYLSNVNLEN